MRNLVALASLLALTSLSSAAKDQAGAHLPEAHHVPLVELIVDSGFLDGQPVRVMGVADFSFEFEGRQRIWLSVEAFERRSFDYVPVSFSEEFEQSHAPFLTSLKGKWVVIEGTAAIEPRERISPTDNIILGCAMLGCARASIENASMVRRVP